MPKHSEQEILHLSDFVDGNLVTEFGWNYISNLASVVISKYFYKYLDYFDKEDLTSLAISDAVAFIIKVVTVNNNTDSTIKNIRNLLFTRIRNTLSNFIFRSNKLVTTEDDILDLNIVYPKSFDVKNDLINLDDLDIDSIDSFRTISTKVWQLFLTNGANQKYIINDDTNDIEDWKSYSEAHNMKKPCDLITIYNDYTEDQIEALANKLDETSGQNYFNTLYQLLGNKFMAFLDVFQEDKFNIPSTVLVKHLLTDMSICDDSDNGLSDEDIATKYGRSLSSVQKILKSREII